MSKYRMLGVLVLLMGCVSTHQENQNPPRIQAAQTATFTRTPAFTATAIPTKTASPTPVPATPTPPFEICSPLEGITLAEMVQPDVLKNGFLLPRPGMDDGHFGADFAFWSRGERKTMLGLPVLSALNGRVAGIINNRQPYGNAIIIETSLADLPASWLAASWLVELATPAPTVQPAPSLYCPADPANYGVHSGRSLYLLYAHLDKLPTAALNQRVACGQVIGEVGTTGRSVNYHLHLETRAGPSGVTFPEMAHYDNAATETEMSTYCTWRVSGLFQAVDPVKVLSLQP